MAINEKLIERKFNDIFAESELPQLARHIELCCGEFGFHISKKVKPVGNSCDRRRLAWSSSTTDYIVDKLHRLKTGHSTNIWIHDNRNPTRTPIVFLKVSCLTHHNGYRVYKLELKDWVHDDPFDVNIWA